MPRMPDEDIFPHATGEAAKTVEQHSKSQPLQFHGSWFCPFVQRAWIVLQELGIDYEWREINPYKKDKEYLAINPKGLVPAITYKGRHLNESAVIMEYLEDISSPTKTLYPKDVFDKAVARMWMDHIAKKICPCFFRVLQYQEQEKQDEARKELLAALTEFVEAMDPKGPFFFGEQFTHVDAMLTPWLQRHPVAFKRFKGGWEIPSSGSPVWDRWRQWTEACKSRKSVIETTSDVEHYMQILERYAKDTAQSEAAKATRAGKKFS